MNTNPGILRSGLIRLLEIDYHLRHSVITAAPDVRTIPARDLAFLIDIILLAYSIDPQLIQRAICEAEIPSAWRASAALIEEHICEMTRLDHKEGEGVPD